MASADLLQQKGQHFVVLCPSTERLVVGLGSNAAPSEFPNAIAYRQTQCTSMDALHSVATPEEERARDEAYHEALTALGIEVGLEVCSTAESEGGGEMQCDRDITEAAMLTGEALYDLTSLDAFHVVYPCRLQGLDSGRSRRQLQDDLAHIWTDAITTCLGLSQKEFCDYGVVLIVPDNYGLGEVDVMVETLFVELAFKEIVVHSDSTAAAFGQGMSGGCIVHVEDTSIRISCIEDGALVPESLHVLPFGGSHMCQALHWILRDQLPSGFQPLQRLCDKHQLMKWRDASCFLPHEGSESAVGSQVRNVSPVKWTFFMENGEHKAMETQLGIAACLAPMGVFHPKLLLPHAPTTQEPLQCTSEEYYMQILADPEEAPALQTAASAKYVQVPLDAAIVQSISSAENVDQRRRLYISILIVGLCSHIKGLSDMVERCVLSALPPDEVIDTVAVLEPKQPSHHLIWKGGAILGCLSDQWIRREEWICGMSLDNKPNKFGKRDIARSKVYWMFKTEIGLI